MRKDHSVVNNYGQLLLDLLKNAHIVPLCDHFFHVRVTCEEYNDAVWNVCTEIDNELSVIVYNGMVFPHLIFGRNGNLVSPLVTMIGRIHSRDRVMVNEC